MERQHTQPFDPSLVLGDERATRQYLIDSHRFEPSDFLPDETSRAEYLAAALETGDVDLVSQARAAIRQARQAEHHAQARSDGFDYSNVLRLRGWGTR